jgi:hypothetical protein
VEVLEVVVEKCGFSATFAASEVGVFLVDNQSRYREVSQKRLYQAQSTYKLSAWRETATQK